MPEAHRDWRVTVGLLPAWWAGVQNKMAAEWNGQVEKR